MVFLRKKSSVGLGLDPIKEVPVCHVPYRPTSRPVCRYT